jgi:hypothetical protein
MDYQNELKKIVHEPAKALVAKMEQHFDKLNIEQKKDLEKLKFGLKMWELEQQEQQEKEHAQHEFKRYFESN